MDDTRDLFERARRTAEEARRVSAESRHLVRTSREIQHWTARVQGRLAGEAARLVAFHSRSNQLLGFLPTAEFERLVPLLQGVCFRAKQVLHHANAAIDYVYFPVSGLLSAVVMMQDGSSIEVAAIGKEGMAGLTACGGSGISPYDVVVQIPGDGLRIDAGLFRRALKQQGTLPGLLTDYQGMSAVQAAYQVACNGLHSAYQRCCRRLLSTQDRIGHNTLALTHDSLALALGVRRATVTEGLGHLQSRGVIECARGHITILDRPTLQALACECYQTINHEFARRFESENGDE